MQLILTPFFGLSLPIGHTFGQKSCKLQMLVSSSPALVQQQPLSYESTGLPLGLGASVTQSKLTPRQEEICSAPD